MCVDVRLLRPRKAHASIDYAQAAGRDPAASDTRGTFSVFIVKDGEQSQITSRGEAAARSMFGQCCIGTQILSHVSLGAPFQWSIRFISAHSLQYPVQSHRTHPCKPSCILVTDPYRRCGGENVHASTQASQLSGYYGSTSLFSLFLAWRFRMVLFLWLTALGFGRLDRLACDAYFPLYLITTFTTRKLELEGEGGGTTPRTDGRVRSTMSPPGCAA